MFIRLISQGYKKHKNEALILNRGDKPPYILLKIINAEIVTKVTHGLAMKM